MLKNTIRQRLNFLRYPVLAKDKKEIIYLGKAEIESFRDDIASMEHPFFALRSGDTKARYYTNKGVKIIVKPGPDGLATIFDKDIWIYSISKLQESLNNKIIINSTVNFTPYAFFNATRRNNGGKNYKLLEKTLSRLKGTVIRTNIVFSERKQEIIEFGLIDSWRIIEHKKGKINIDIIEITLPKWLCQALYKNKIIKINTDYFNIRKAIDRRIYEIARKHCGIQKEFIITLEKLYLKTGSTSLFKVFKYNIKKLVTLNNLPDYEIYYNSIQETISFKKRNNNI